MSQAIASIFLWTPAFVLGAVVLYLCLEALAWTDTGERLLSWVLGKIGRKLTLGRPKGVPRDEEK
jgi:hypothetical protein